MRGAVLLVLVVGCGRLGFGEPPANTPPIDSASDAPGIIKPDAPPPIDADPTIDAAQGTGSYQIAQANAPYAALEGAVPVPGFAPGTADDENFMLVLPFAFTFFGITYTTVTVSVNGYVTFGAPVTASDSFTNDCPLDGTSPDATIAVFWDDLLSNPNAPIGTLATATAGAAPDRTFSIEWRDLDAWYQAGGGNNAFNQDLRVTQTLVLHETGVIEIHYGPRTPPRDASKDCGPQRHLGCSATVGLEAPGSTVTQLVQCGTAAGPLAGFQPTIEGRLITFTPQ